MRLVKSGWAKSIIVSGALIVAGVELAEEPGSAVGTRRLGVFIENQLIQEFKMRTVVDCLFQDQAGPGHFLGAPVDTGEQDFMTDQMNIPLQVAPGRASKSFEFGVFEKKGSNLWRRSCYGR